VVAAQGGSKTRYSLADVQNLCGRMHGGTAGCARGKEKNVGAAKLYSENSVKLVSFIIEPGEDKGVRMLRKE